MTLADGTYTAVVDRIEEGTDERLAVLVVEGEEHPPEELVVPVGDLPDAARRPDTVLEVTIEAEHPVEMSVDHAATEHRAENAQDRFDRLSQRLADDTDTDT